MTTIEKLTDILSKRIMVLDGAMGTQIQLLGLAEEDFRGELLREHPIKVKGNNDLLSLTRPEAITRIHRNYLEAGADIIETNTFNAQSVSQSEYGTEGFVARMNLESARIARQEADRMTALTPDKPRFVAGSVGPTGKTLSMSPSVESPAFRAIDFDILCAAYVEQIEALLDGGVDLILIETIFDTLNAKAALEATRIAFEHKGLTLPIMLSATVADAAGRTLSGQTLEAFIASVTHAGAFSIGLNCSFGAEQMLPFLRQVSAAAPCFVSAYPNAGLPDAMGKYDETPAIMAADIAKFAKERLVNIVGGCCGSTPEHIKAIAEAVEGCQTLRLPKRNSNLPWLTGLDGFRANGAFINVGERCNVAGSRKFLRLISEKNYDDALTIARKQVRDGAMVLDINMDDGMLDARTEMVNFLNLMASDPEIARIPWMVDSSRFEVIEAALKCIQGKAIVNSISLKEGEQVFLHRAKRVKELGAALIVMAFDEQGQATTLERKTQVCQRAYQLLTEKLAFNPNDIIFDPNVLTIATGMKEHDRYALDFINATRWIHEHLPHARVSGGVSNLSFAFRGNNYIREAMHAVFLYHAIRAGLDMAIVNPSTKVMYADIPQDLLEALEDAILYRREDATERLVEIAERYKGKKTTEKQEETIDRASLPVGDRLINALKRGDEEFLEADINEALTVYSSPSAIIEGPLMQGMSMVGDLFGAGKMFLPQVVKTARTMKHAVSILQPYIMAGQTAADTDKNGKYLLATVKGDVHDIGKNIAAVVLACNNFDVTDLGVMVPAEKIVEAAQQTHADYIGLSGLITPSLDEMCIVAAALRKAGISVPLFIGGATTSALHTAVKIAPLYDGPVFHVKDAAQNPVLAMQLNGSERKHVIACLKFEQEQLRQHSQRTETTSLSQEQALALRPNINWDAEKLVEPTYTGLRMIDHIDIQTVRPYINWIHFYNLWSVKKGTPEAENIKNEAEALLDRLSKKYYMQAEVAFYKAYGTDDSIVVDTRHECHDGCCMPRTLTNTVVIPTPRQRKAGLNGRCNALCDYVAPQGKGDHIGAFAVTVSTSFVEQLEQLKRQGDQYKSLLMQSLGDRLAEATSEWLHAEVRRSLWGFAPNEQLTIKQMYAAHYQGIRPAVGYPSLPDQKTIFVLARLIDFKRMGIRLTENGAMYPQASVCGLYIASPHAYYFMV